MNTPTMFSSEGAPARARKIDRWMLVIVSALSVTIAAVSLLNYYELARFRWAGFIDVPPTSPLYVPGEDGYQQLRELLLVTKCFSTFFAQDISRMRMHGN